jgi:hypothetical protein
VSAAEAVAKAVAEAMSMPALSVAAAVTVMEQSAMSPAQAE